MTDRPLKAGVVGLGVGAASMLRRLEASPLIELCAGADIDAEAREGFRRVFPRVRVYDSVEQLAVDPEVEAVWVMTPNRFHAEHTVAAADAGKHVAVTKPMAITLQEAEEMVAAAERNAVTLITGNSHSFATPTRMMAQIAHSGQLGKVCAINIFAYNDWLLRTRRPEDFDLSHGGGIVYRAAPHQIDTIRLIGRGKLKSVRGTVGEWMPERPAPGYYAAYMEFEDGTPAVAIQNAYGYFDGEEIVPWRSSPVPDDKVAGRVARRRAVRNPQRNELAEYLERRVGGAMDSDSVASGGQREFGTDLGIVIVSCERGDIRQSPDGVYVYSDQGVREVKLRRGSLLDAEIEELYDAVVRGRKPIHGGRWGLATMEVMLAIMESARTHREVALTHQYDMGADYSAASPIDSQEAALLT